ncbi:lysozyme-like isoform X2 [Palaemon carinicauda]|uniref:lysozyme-like isoform X2 n=1 Tax=Palaemon carinicauda TaxID=392227 RepID=UPI0035B63DAA
MLYKYVRTAGIVHPWLWCIWIPIAVGLLQASNMSDAEKEAKCLRCICEASSSCNANIVCSKPYFGGYRCGPLSISWHYWADAGAPKLEGDENLPSEIAFKNCVEEIYCAVETVRNYMNKFKNGTTADCNSDDKIDCEDYVQMHILE